MAFANTQENDYGTRITKSEKLPDPKKRKVKKWIVMLNVGKTYYGREQEFKYTCNGHEYGFTYMEAYKVASENSVNIEYEGTSFKIAKEHLVYLAEHYPLGKLILARKVDLTTVLYPIH